MSSGNVCTAIKPGSTSMYMCKTHFPEQQGQGMKGKVGKFQLLVSGIQARVEKMNQNHSKACPPDIFFPRSLSRYFGRHFKGTNLITNTSKQNQAEGE